MEIYKKAINKAAKNKLIAISLAGFLNSSSLIARIVERIPTIKNLLKRLQEDILFRMDCGFSLAETILSAASYSRLVKKISQSHALEEIHEHMLKQAISAGFILMIP